MTINCGEDFHARQQTACHCDTAEDIRPIAGRPITCARAKARRRSSRRTNLRPGGGLAEELYGLRRDPAQVSNVAGEHGYAGVRRRPADRLMRELRRTGGPRAHGEGDTFDRRPFRGPGLKGVELPEDARRKVPSSVVEHSARS